MSFLPQITFDDAAHPRRGPAHRRQHRQAAGSAAEGRQQVDRPAPIPAAITGRSSITPTRDVEADARPDDAEHLAALLLGDIDAVRGKRSGAVGVALLAVAPVGRRWSALSVWSWWECSYHAQAERRPSRDNRHHGAFLGVSSCPFSQAAAWATERKACSPRR